MATARIKPVVCIFLAVSCLVTRPGDAAPVSLNYVGLYAAANHSVCYVSNPGGFYPFTVWVWWLPSETGMQAAEFAIQHPGIVIGASVTQNPAITVALGSLPSGISVAFGACQTGWTWTHYQQCYLTATAVDYVRLVPHPAAGACQIATCEVGYPIAPVTIIQHLALNDSWCTHPEHNPAALVGIIIQTSSAVRAIFSECVQADMPPGHFVLHNKADSADSINVLQATRMGDNEYDLVLAAAMADSTTYLLATRVSFWGCDDYMYSHSTFEFTFLEATATETSSWGAIKALYR